MATGDIEIDVKDMKMVNETIEKTKMKHRYLDLGLQAEQEDLRPRSSPILVLSGPSGSGKSTLLSKVMAEFPSFAFGISHTTRAPRAGEVHGRHYWFSERQAMERQIAAGEFLEHASFGGNLYGTSFKSVEEIQKTGRICVLDLELQGVRNVKKAALGAKFVLIKAPSIEALEERLRGRKTESEDSLKKRLKHAKEDLDAIEDDPTLFDQVIVNDNLEYAYGELRMMLLKNGFVQ
ncbi:hypothetical protein L596_012366 [Steinernema carpocapsae]|nr:hypothetical protein L596_012366 [Steinernema carpocapsae]